MGCDMPLIGYLSGDKISKLYVDVYGYIYFVGTVCMHAYALLLIALYVSATVSCTMMSEHLPLQTYVSLRPSPFL